MLFWGIMYVALIAAVLFVLYSIYKVIWYIVKILVLFGKVSKLARGGVTVQWLRHPLKIIFGQKGVPIFTVGMSGKNYEVSVLSFISTHSRWNIEKTRTRYLFEVRKYNKILYNVYNNSGTEPELSKEYRRETRLYRKELYVSPISEAYEKQIWLVSPKPRLLTYTDTGWEYLIAGSVVGGHEIMYAKDFFELFFKEKKS
mgnify:FL=1